MNNRLSFIVLLFFAAAIISALLYARAQLPFWRMRGARVNGKYAVIDQYKEDLDNKMYLGMHKKDMFQLIGPPQYYSENIWLWMQALPSDMPLVNWNDVYSCGIPGYYLIFHKDKLSYMHFARNFNEPAFLPHGVPELTKKLADDFSVKKYDGNAMSDLIGTQRDEGN